MPRLQRRRFTDPAEVRQYPKGRTEIVELDQVVVGRIVEQPGWRWSVDLRSLAGTELCQLHHMGFALEGRLRVELVDGTQIELGPGDVFEIPPDHDAWVVGDAPWVAIEFAGIRSYGRSSDDEGSRILVSILMTDIVDSTSRARELGEQRWREVLGEHNEIALATVERYRGRILKWTGDGLIAIFDAPDRAARAAIALREATRTLDLGLRQAVHTGEVELLRDDLRGLAVHATARIMALAGPDEVLVSGTVRDILDESAFRFEDRGAHELKGFSGARTVYAIDRAPARPSD